MVSQNSTLDDTLLSEMTEHSEVYYAVLSLPAVYRTVIHLFTTGVCGSRDCGFANCKQSTVKSRLHRARNLLKESLKGDYFDV